MAKAAKEKKVKKSKKEKAVALDTIDTSDRIVGFDIGSLMDDELDVIEKKVKISSQDAARFAPRVSTGQLALDMFLSGGIVPGGWYTFSGGEQSCKSTLTMSLMASLIKLQYSGISAVFDYEGSTDADYIAGQLKTFGVTVDPKTIFGVRDPDDEKKWLIKPRIRYYAPDNGTRFFDWMSMLRRRLPKKIVEKDGSAWLYFENNKENAKKVAGQYDKKWFSAHNEFKVRAADGHMQAMVIVDSYPAMLPDQLDDDEGSNAMAIQARMFSDGIKRFRGGMRGKMMTIVGVNQLRQKPATMFGSPEYEPGGDALKFYCFAEDTQIRTNYGTLTAPQIKNIMDNQTDDCVPVLVETQGGFEPIAKAWRVEEDRIVMEMVTGNSSYVGSDMHRQLVFIQDCTDQDEPAMRTEFRTLSQIAQQQDDSEVYAVMRLVTPGEIRLHGPKAADPSRRYVLQFMDNHARHCVVNIRGDYRATGTDLYVGRDHVQPVISSLADVGVIAQSNGPDSVYVPAIRPDVLKNILIDGAATEKAQLAQRSIMIHLAIDHVFPELSAFVAEYNTLISATASSHFGTDTEEDTYLYLADDATVELALSALLARSIDLPHMYDKHDELSRQAAYVEDLTGFEPNGYPMKCRAGYVRDERATTTKLWDVTVPSTSVIVTNGFVSHNSDVRIRLASRAVPSGWPTLKDERGIVGEKSVTVENGTDRYRFIAAKTIKNKMGGIPNQSTWMRLWEADGNGEARGFDPVFDTWHYLKTLGLIVGMRKKFRIKAPCPLASDKSMDWDQFRTLINGSKKQIAEVCSQLGVKPAGLRAWCFKFIVSDKGQAMLKDSISRSAKGGDDEEE